MTRREITWLQVSYQVDTTANTAGEEAELTDLSEQQVPRQKKGALKKGALCKKPAAAQMPAAGFYLTKNNP
ncbi:MAG: hypothetical protein ACOX6Z_07855 [Dethiobacteria bacterium]